jgi:catechol 2,3-dioxygenase-like lactoylglutathione lyase family enzyme
MIDGISNVFLYVKDQDRAKKFWTETMGFELVQDTPYNMGEGPQERWLVVMPPDRGIKLNLQLTPKGFPEISDELSWMLFTCEDIQQTYKELTERGVEFTEAPSEQFWGWWAVFKDPDGHLIGLGQRRQSAES